MVRDPSASNQQNHLGRNSCTNPTKMKICSWKTFSHEKDFNFILFLNEFIKNLFDCRHYLMNLFIPSTSLWILSWRRETGNCLIVLCFTKTTSDLTSFSCFDSFFLMNFDLWIFSKRKHFRHKLILISVMMSELCLTLWLLKQHWLLINSLLSINSLVTIWLSRISFLRFLRSMHHNFRC